LEKARDLYDFSFKASVINKYRRIPITILPANIVRPARNPRIIGNP
jgi:hypothetical protein